MQEKQNNTGLVWFRNDLRIQDNSVLHKAIATHKNVIALYCFDPRQFVQDQFGFKKTEKYRAKFLIETVTDLKKNLKALHIELFVFVAKPEDVIPNLIDTYSVPAVYLQKEWTSEELQVLEAVKTISPKTTTFHEYYNQFLYHPDDINIAFKDIPQVFTNFRKKVEKYSSIRPEAISLNATLKSSMTNTTKIPQLEDLGFNTFKTHPNTAFPFTGGETAALQRLDDYIFKTKNIGRYKNTRNGLLGVDYSSKFSPWLANGSLSPKTIYWAIKRFEDEHYKNQSTYWLVFELIWRDYFKYISLKHGNAIFKRNGILNRDYHWNTKNTDITAWINGETSSSFVNANMVELKTTGWMSNRGRQNVASYFAKDLMLDWRIGAAYFECLLLDYDVHSNYGNWMYVAGVGNDPRDRKFNVALQAEHYDANGKFQNLWLQPTLF